MASLRNNTMKIQLSKPEHINGWMALVEQVRDAFPGLETAEAMAEHRATVLQFIQASSAICALEAGRVVGAPLVSKEKRIMWFFGGGPPYRKERIVRDMGGF